MVDTLKKSLYDRTIAVYLNYLQACKRALYVWAAYVAVKNMWRVPTNDATALLASFSWVIWTRALCTSCVCTKRVLTAFKRPSDVIDGNTFLEHTYRSFSNRAETEILLWTEFKRLLSTEILNTYLVYINKSLCYKSLFFSKINNTLWYVKCAMFC